MKKFKSLTTAENMEYYIFLNNAGKFCVALRDLDAEQNVAVTICKDEEQANAVFAEWVNNESAGNLSIPL